MCFGGGFCSRSLFISLSLAVPSVSLSLTHLQISPKPEAPCESSSEHTSLPAATLPWRASENVALLNERRVKTGRKRRVKNFASQEILIILRSMYMYKCDIMRIISYHTKYHIYRVQYSGVPAIELRYCCTCSLDSDTAVNLVYRTILHTQSTFAQTSPNPFSSSETRPHAGI